MSVHGSSPKFGKEYKQVWKRKTSIPGKLHSWMAKKSEQVYMGYGQTVELSKGVGDNTAFLVKEAVMNISSRVQQKYGLIKPETIPDRVNYAKAEKYLRSVNVEVNHKMFTLCIKEQLLSGGHEVKNNNLPMYTHEQIIYYILVDLFKPILPLGKIKVLFYDVLRPMIYIIGLDATYVRLCENILAKMDSFDNAVALALQDDSHTVQHPDSQMENTADDVVQAIGSIAYYTRTD